MVKPLARAVVESHGSARGLRKFQAYMQISRWNAAPLGALPTGLGALAAGFDTARTSAVVLLTFVVLVFANILNALGDIEQDRTDPRRRSEAMVSGSLSSHQVTLTALVLLLGIGPASVLLLDNAAATIAYLAMVGLAAYTNLYAKRSVYGHPVLMDFLFGLYYAAPMLIVASLSAHTLQAPLVLLACSFLLQITAYIVVICTMKDLECDIGYGVRGSAIELGVRPGPDGPVISRAFAIYAIAIQVGGLLTGLAAGLLAAPTRLGTVAFTALGAALLIAGTVNLVMLVTRPRAVVRASSHIWFFTNYVATGLIATGQLAPAGVWLLLAGILAATGLSILASERDPASQNSLTFNLLFQADNRY